MRRMFLNGAEQRIGYLGQLRIDSRYRGRWLVSRGFARLKQLHEAEPLPAYLASIVGGNSEAEGVLVRRARRGFPEFSAVAEVRTLAIEVRRPKAALGGDLKIAAPDESAVAELVEFLNLHGARRQFTPVWTAQSLARLSQFGLRLDDIRVARRGGKMLGVMALWDQSAFKQTVIQGYSGWLKALGPAHNLAAPFTGRPGLPRPGEKLKSAYVSLLCIAGDDIAVFRALLREMYKCAQQRGLSYLLAGFDARDTLLKPASEYANVIYPSRLYLAEWRDGDSGEDDRSEHTGRQLDGRPAYADIATL
jgi:hypothetical protein